MARYALVKDGSVANMIEYDGSAEVSLDGTLVVADDNTWIGGTYDGSSFSEKPTPPVVEPTPEQVVKEANIANARAKLEALGLNLDEIRDAFRI